MKVGIAFANIGPFGSAEGAAAVGRSAEAAAGAQRARMCAVDELTSR